MVQPAPGVSVSINDVRSDRGASHGVGILRGLGTAGRVVRQEPFCGARIERHRVEDPKAHSCIADCSSHFPTVAVSAEPALGAITGRFFRSSNVSHRW